MNGQEGWKNKLYYGDNLHIMREHIADESVDLIYLDPPFNSQATYNVLFGEHDGSQSQAQIMAFEDTWHWGQESEYSYREIVEDGSRKLSDLIQALRSFLGQNDMMAYLVMMAIRLAELRRVLKRCGSIYLHCDPNASHYLKLILDVLMGADNFLAEIIWKRTSAHTVGKRPGHVHDVLLLYSKTSNYLWNPSYQPYDESYLDAFYTHRDKDGRRWYRSDLTRAEIRHGETGKPWRGIDVTAKGRHWSVAPAELDKLDAQGKIHWPAKPGGMPRLRCYMDEMPGVPLQDVWVDIPPMHNLSAERLGYPTQKPETLLERIIKASSNEEGVVFDPFCGCGTAINVAERLGRRWLGIDITHLAIALIKSRLHDTFGPELSPYEVIGSPRDLSSAKALAEQDRYQFEWWALSLVEARPAQDKKKGADSGIDGYINFFDDNSGKAKKIIVQVKSGHVNAGMIRDLKGVLDREKATIGVFITLNPSTKPMRDEALSAGYYSPEHLARQHTAPKIQIVTIAELLDDAQIQYPRMLVTTFKKAERKYKEPTATQEELL